MSGVPRLRTAGPLGPALVLSLMSSGAGQSPALPAHPSSAITPVGLLAKPFDDAVPNAEQLRRGQYLVAAGDCLSCHVREGGEPFSGGLGLSTPFGAIYASNITPDRLTGIGSWTNDQFYKAMHDGKGI